MSSIYTLTGTWRTLFLQTHLILMFGVRSLCKVSKFHREWINNPLGIFIHLNSVLGSPLLPCSPDHYVFVAVCPTLHCTRLLCCKHKHGGLNKEVFVSRFFVKWYAMLCCYASWLSSSLECFVLYYTKVYTVWSFQLKAFCVVFVSSCWFSINLQIKCMISWKKWWKLKISCGDI